MVLPYLTAAGALASGAGALGGLLSSNRQNDIARAQNNLALQAFYEQRRRQQLQDDMARAGYTDARGNRTEYVPGVGWVERPTDQTRNLIAADDNEQMLRLSQDAPRARALREAGFRRQLDEGAIADGLRASLERDPQPLEALRAAMIRSAVTRAQEGRNDAARAYGMMALRQGTSASDALASLDRRGMMQTRTAIADADLEAPAEYEARRANRWNNRLNQYGALAARASAPDSMPFQPSTLPQQIGGASQRLMAGAASQLSGQRPSSPTLNQGTSGWPQALDSLGAYLTRLGRDGRNLGWWGSSSSDRNRTPSGGTATNWGNYADYQGFDDYRR